MENFFTEYKAKFEAFCADNLPKIAPKELYEPYHYLMGLEAKRIRPMLMLATKSCYGEVGSDDFKAALAIELFHNFSLMHDDIMDKSDTRRGYPTVHKKFSENSAILSGDTMLILSYQLLEKIENTAHFLEIYKLYNKTATQICVGQQLDMNFETEFNVIEPEYLMMIEHKTAVLLACSMKIGAILGDATDADKQAFYQFGLNMGMAFQIQDDLLDTFGESAAVGKRIGGDICNNKKTLLLIRAIQNAQSVQKDILMQWQQTSEFNDDKVRDITQIFIDSGAKNYVVNKRNQYHQLALNSIENISISAEMKENMINFANKAVNRIK
jgi:geranylgeranyl diphosphate synthase, type II